MTIRLTLICHASTSAMRTAAFPADEPIDASARTKLAAVSNLLQKSDRCLTSPLLRARQTAEVLGLKATVEPALRECDYGRWTGRALGDIEALEPEAVGAWLTDPDAAPHGGESLVMLIARVSVWLDGQVAQSGTTIVVTHAAVIRAAIVHAIEAGPKSFWRIDVAPLSVTQLIGDRGRWNVRSLGPLATRLQDAELGGEADRS